MIFVGVKIGQWVRLRSEKRQQSILITYTQQISQVVIFSAKGLLLAEQAAICARIETFEPCVTEFGLWAEDQLSGGLTDGESLFN